MRITYRGPSDSRVLNADDLAKAGVESFDATTFERGVAAEVSDEIGQAILNNPALYGDFVNDEEVVLEVEAFDANESAEQVPSNEGSAPDVKPAPKKVKPTT